LIRSQQDRGIVVLLDPRVRTKPYGRLFLDSLPDCAVVEESSREQAEAGV
jgi:ATP-dependent DNA helicase DinG